MNAIVREYKKEDVPAMRAIWNEVVAEGVAFPQMEELTQRQAEDFFANQEPLRRGGGTGDGARCGPVYSASQ